MSELKNITRIAIIGAMDNEIQYLKETMEDVEIEMCGPGKTLKTWKGTLGSAQVFVAKSGIGKVNAALCTQILIDTFSPQLVINTGIAGGIDPCLSVGDAVIAKGLIQHDFDVTAFGHVRGYMSTGEDDTVPTVYFPDRQAAYLMSESASELMSAEQVKEGVIVTGDQFVSKLDKKKELHETFGAMAAEMEGGAIAQAASYNNVPFVSMRVISDLAQGGSGAVQSYEEFEDNAARLSAMIVISMIGKIENDK